MADVKCFRVRNWEQFQHYKDRNPPWIKLHFALLASEDWVTLDDASKLLAVVCMLIMGKCRTIRLTSSALPTSTSCQTLSL